MIFVLDLQRFADAGTLVNASEFYVNSGTGEPTSFSGVNTLAPEMKDYYNNDAIPWERLYTNN